MKHIQETKAGPESASGSVTQLREFLVPRYLTGYTVTHGESVFWALWLIPMAYLVVLGG